MVLIFSTPTHTQLQDTDLELVVAGTADAVMMVESEAKELSEEVMLGAVTFGHEQMQPIIDLLIDLAEEAGKAPWDLPAKGDPALLDSVRSKTEADLREAFSIQEKQARSTRLNEIKDALLADYADQEDIAEPKILDCFKK